MDQSISRDQEYTEHRIESCREYPGTYTSTEIAGSGFLSLNFFTSDSHDDRLACVRCGLVLEFVPPGLSLVLLHLICSHCPFVRRLLEKLKSDERSTQIADEEGTSSTAFRVREEVDVQRGDNPETIYNKYNSIRYVTLYLSESVRSLLLRSTQSSRPEPASIDILSESLGLGSNADTTQMAREENRTETFRTFANDDRLPISRLVQSGFYWTGESLEMKTFCCGKTSSDWMSNSDPILRHAQLARSCTFLNSQYQPEYLERLLEGNEEYEPPQPNLLIERVLPKHIKPIMDSLPVVSIRNNWKKFVAEGGRQETLKKELAECISERIKYGRGGYRSENEVITDLQKQRNKKQDRQEKTTRKSEDKLKGLRVYIDNTYTREIMKQQEREARERRQATNNQPGGPLIMDVNEVSSNMRCIICLSNVREILYVPCTHLVTCAGCSLTQSMCPICRSTIKGTVKVNLLPSGSAIGRSQPVRQPETIDLINPNIPEIDLRSIVERERRTAAGRAGRTEMLSRVEGNKMDEAGAVDNTIHKTEGDDKGASASVASDPDPYNVMLPPDIVQATTAEVFRHILRDKSTQEERPGRRSDSPETSSKHSVSITSTLPPMDADDDMQVE